MAQSTVSIRMDADLKKRMDELCEAFGMSFSTAVTVFSKAVVRERKIPFEIVADGDPFYGEANMRHIADSIRQFEEGSGLVVEMTMEQLEAIADGELIAKPDGTLIPAAKPSMDSSFSENAGSQLAQNIPLDAPAMDGMKYGSEGT